MNRWKKWLAACVCVAVWMIMGGCVTAAAPAAMPSKVSSPPITEVVQDSIMEVAYATDEVVEAASKEVEVIETLDRTKPLYEVYKDGWAVEVPVEWQWYIRDLCNTYDLPEKTIYGLILKESTFQPDVESFDGGCWGLAQISTYWINGANITHFTDDYRSRDLCDPYDNLLTLAEMMCYARDAYGLDFNTKMGQNHYLYWHATGKSPVKVTWIGPSATKAFRFAEELVPLQS